MWWTALAPRPGYVIDLSFGIGVVSAVAEYGLTAADFASSGQTIEMLYLAEANSVAMAEARRLIHGLEMSRDAAQAASLTDGLTGLGNRRALRRLARSQGARRAAPSRFCRWTSTTFKSVNDTHGHGIGDAVLTAAARRLEGGLRPGDDLARVGGDEFVAIVDDPTDGDRLRALADRPHRVDREAGLGRRGRMPGFGVDRHSPLPSLCRTDAGRDADGCRQGALCREADGSRACEDSRGLGGGGGSAGRGVREAAAGDGGRPGHAGEWRGRALQWRLGTSIICLPAARRRPLRFRQVLIDVPQIKRVTVPARSVMGKPTVHDIAKEAGVSLATVDRVLNRRPGVRTATVARVQAAIDKLGYVRDLSAANLARGRLYRLAFVLPDRKSQFSGRGGGGGGGGRARAPARPARPAGGAGARGRPDGGAPELRAPHPPGGRRGGRGDGRRNPDGARHDRPAEGRGRGRRRARHGPAEDRGATISSASTTSPRAGPRECSWAGFSPGGTAR